MGNGGRQTGGKKDKNFVQKYQIMGRTNPSSKDKSTKNFMCVTENAKEFPEQGFLQDVKKIIELISRCSLWKKWEIGNVWMRRTLWHRE